MAAITGCQSLGGLHFAHRAQPDRASIEQNRTLFTRQGVELLKAGDNGAAIEAYNLALATGEEPAPAYNGLGVAYARLGRPDLAYRFFTKATMGAPDNVTFARNRARLMDSPEFAAMLERRRGEQALARIPEQVAPQAAMAQTVVRQPGMLHRDGDRQVSLVTVPAAEVAAAADSRRSARLCRKQSVNCAGQTMPQTASRRRQAEGLAMNRQDQHDVAAVPVAEKDAGTESQGKRKVIVMPAATASTSQTAL
ncbi:MAG: hypothetical protein U1E37_01375 [Sphingomonadaceae bacterium]